MRIKFIEMLYEEQFIYNKIQFLIFNMEVFMIWYQDEFCLK